MKKTILIIIGLICLGFVIAGVGVGIRNIDTEIDMGSKEKKEALISIGFVDITRNIYNRSDGMVQLCLSKQDCQNYTRRNVTYTDCKNVINKCSSFMSDQSKLDDWETNLIDRIANATLARQRPEKTLIGNGTLRIR